MKKPKKLDPLSFSQFQALLFALVGFLLGVVYSFGGLILDALVTLGWITSSETPGLSEGTVLAFGALIGMPVLFLVAGFFLGIIEAVMYNLFIKIAPKMSIKIYK